MNHIISFFQVMEYIYFNYIFLMLIYNLSKNIYRYNKLRFVIYNSDQQQQWVFIWTTTQQQTAEELVAKNGKGSKECDR